MPRPSSATIKETIEYDADFLNEWGTFCDTKGYVKRQATHAARIAFMNLTPEQRESAMKSAVEGIKRKSKK